MADGGAQRRVRPGSGGPRESDESSESHERTGELRFALVTAALFVAATLPRLLRHELWRDEAWLWLVVSDSRSLGELFVPLARSGQGYLFPILCFLAKSISGSPVAMQMVQLLLGASSAFVVARWAPFPRPLRILILLGYFPFYEYGLISRHYVAGMLLAFLACASLRRKWPPFVTALSLALLCQTTVYGFLLAIAIGLGAIVDGRRSVELRRLAAPALVVLGGGVLGVVQLVPAPGTSFAPGGHFGWSASLAEKTAALAAHAFLPLPLPKIPFWNTSFLDTWPGADALVGFGMLALALALFRGRTLALLVFGTGAAGLLAFSYVKFLGSMRHQGHLWLLFLAALWLGGGIAEGERSFRRRAVTALLAVHVAAGAFASAVDWRAPFSNGAAAAALLRDRELDRLPLFGHREPPVSSVSLPLGKPLFAPSRGIYAMYPDWGPEQRELPPAAVRCAARALALRESSDVVLVLNHDAPDWPELTLLAKTSGAIEASEDYRIYRLRKDSLAATRDEAHCGE